MFCRTGTVSPWRRLTERSNALKKSSLENVTLEIVRFDSLWFSELMIPSVPVVVLFTKFDALRPLAMAKMTPADLKLPLRERLSKAKPLTEEVFGEANIWGRLSKMTYPPKSSIRIERESHASLYLPDYIYYSLQIRHAQVK